MKYIALLAMSANLIAYVYYGLDHVMWLAAAVIWLAVFLITAKRQ